MGELVRVLGWVTVAVVWAVAVTTLSGCTLHVHFHVGERPIVASSAAGQVLSEAQEQALQQWEHETDE